MPQFAYIAKKDPEHFQKGVVEAETAFAASLNIAHQKLFPIEITKLSEKGTINRKTFNFSQYSKSITKNDIIEMTLNLSDLIDAFVPLLQCLKILKRQIQKEPLKNILENIYQKVKNGRRLSQALKEYPKYFSDFYISLVCAGEKSGELNEVLKRLSQYLCGQRETQNKILAALAYPMFVFATGMITGIILLCVVFPKISLVFMDFDQRLPLPTQMIIQTSDFFQNYGLFLIVLCLFIFLSLGKKISSKKRNQIFNMHALGVPFLKEGIKTFELGKFARCMFILTSSGVSVLSSLEISCSAIGNEILKKEMRSALKEVKQGTLLGSALRRCSMCSKITLDILNVCEYTGQIEKGFLKVAEISERKMHHKIKVLISVIGPFALICVVGMVGFLVLAMIMPILQMNMMVQ